MEVIQKKIAAIAVVNDEILQRITTKVSTNEPILGYSYSIIRKESIFEVVEEPLTQMTSTIVSKWRCAMKFSPVEDLFNDKINCTCTTFEDVKRLCQVLPPIAKKYRMFGEHADPSVFEILNQFKTNFELLQTALGQIETLLQNAKSEKEKLQTELDETNTLFEKASLTFQQFKTEHPGFSLAPYVNVVFNPPPKPQVNVNPSYHNPRCSCCGSYVSSVQPSCSTCGIYVSSVKCQSCSLYYS